MRFAILGAGAVGGYFGGRLAQSGADVVFLARGSHLDAIRRDGLEVKSARGDFRVAARATDRPGEAAPVDCLVVAVKAYDTRAAAAPCRPILAPDGFALTLQNGLGNVETLGEIFGADRVVGGVAYIGAGIAGPGRIVQETGGTLVIGEPDGRVTPRVGRVKAAFDAAGAPCEVTTDLPQAVWEKLMANAVFNVIAAAFGVELGDILSRRMRPLAEKAIEELEAVARAKGIEVRPRAREHCWRFCERHPTFRTSTQQDLARGKPTEWEALSAALVAEARKAGVDVPTHEMLGARLRARSTSTGG